MVSGGRPNGGFGGLFQVTRGNCQIPILTLLPARLKVTPNPPQTPIELCAGTSDRPRSVARSLAFCAAPVTAWISGALMMGLGASVEGRSSEVGRNPYRTHILGYQI